MSHRGSTDPASWRAARSRQGASHLAVEQQLNDRSLIRTVNRPHRVDMHPDVAISLRYRAVDD